MTVGYSHWNKTGRHTATHKHTGKMYLEELITSLISSSREETERFWEANFLLLSFTT